MVAIAVFQLKVAATVGKGIVIPEIVDHHVVLGALIGAISWNVNMGSPLLGFLLAATLMIAVAWLFRRVSPLHVDNWFRRAQLVSAGLYSLGHGGNDAQKTIGIIWMLLIATGYATVADVRPAAWVIWSCFHWLIFFASSIWYSK